MLFNVHITHEAYLGLEKGGGRREKQANSSSAHSRRLAKTEETISHRQNNDVKKVRTPPVPSSSCTSLIAVSTAVRSKVTKFCGRGIPLQIYAQAPLPCINSQESPFLEGTTAPDTILQKPPIHQQKTPAQFPV